MYWKYHIEAGDLVTFTHEGRTVHGTVKGWLNPDKYADTPLSEVEPSDFTLVVQSGTEDVKVNLADVKSTIEEDDRETDIPLFSEEFRLSGGVNQAR